MAHTQLEARHYLDVFVATKQISSYKIVPLSLTGPKRFQTKKAKDNCTRMFQLNVSSTLAFARLIR